MKLLSSGMIRAAVYPPIRAQTNTQPRSEHSGSPCVVVCHSDQICDRQLCAVAGAFAPNAASLRIVAMDNLLPQELDNCDLVLVQMKSRSTTDQLKAVTSIRNASLAPVVILTAHDTPAEDLDILLAGADAVIPLFTTPNVIVAHCQALIRRWQAR